MLFIEIAISLAICLLLSGGSMITARSEMLALQQSQLLLFYTEDMPSVNLAIQKLVAGAESFNIYNSETAAASNDAGNLTPTGGVAVRLTYPKNPVTNQYTIGILYFDGSNHLCYGCQTTSHINDSVDITPNSSWYVAGTAVASASYPFSASFSVADSSDSTAAGLLVTTINQGSRQVTLYAERF